MTLSRIVATVVVVLIYVSAVLAVDIDKSKLKSQLIKHEGKRSKVYKDSEGIPTIGVGFNLSRNDAKAKIEDLGIDYNKVLTGDQELTDAQIDKLLTADIEVAIAGARSVVKNFDSLSDVRKRVVSDMVFNLGKAGFSQFTKMISAIEERNFDDAAKEMKNSKWCSQVKSRCTALAFMMLSDKDSP